MTRFRVLVSDPLDKDGLEILRSTGQIEVLVETKLAHDELKRRLNEVDGVVVRSGTTITGDLLEGNTRLRVIGRAGIGVDNVDVPAATRIGAVVMNTPGGNAVTTAEHAIALMMAAARMIPQAHAKLQAGTWDRKTFVGTELSGKTLGVVGLGNIGALVAERGQGLKMRVAGYDPFVTKERAAKLGIELMDLDQLIREADVLTLHIPLGDKTRNLIAWPQFQAMKKTAILVNAARGGIVNEADLDRALREGEIAAAAADVFETEPLPANSPLLSNPKMVVTPHLGASTHEAQIKVSIAIAEQINAFLLGGEVRNAVNAPSVTQETLARVGPFIELGGRLGALVSQLHEGPVARIVARFEGELAGQDTTPVVARIVQGVLSQATDEPVNVVNAIDTARRRGIDIEVTTNAHAEDYVSSLVVKLEGTQRSSEVTGTVFGKREPRIVRIDNFHLEAWLQPGPLVLVENRDVPGVIGRVGSLMGEAGVNIAQMFVGRTGEKGDRALTLITLDSAADEALLGRLRAIDGMVSVRQVLL